MKPKLITNCCLFLAVLLSFWAVRPLFSSGFFPMHDDTQVARVSQMSRALGDGQFPVRWVSDLGYGFGYPVYNFYAPLAYYAGGLLGLIFDSLLATKLMFGVGIVMAGVFMYLLAREFWGEIGGLVSGLFYVYAPYHAVQVYVRGAVGEFWATAFLPLVFLVVYKIFCLFSSTSRESRSLPYCLRGVFGQFLRWIVIGALSLAALILSHNLTVMMATPFLIMILLFCYFISSDKKLFALRCSLFVVLGLAFSAFYWLPALTEMRLTKVFGQIGGGADFRDHFVFLDQLWASPWGFGGSAPNRLDGMSFMVGKLHLVAALFSLPFAWFFRKKQKRMFWGILGAWGILSFSIFLTNRISRPIWELVRPMAFIQYPWRFLSFATLAASFMAGAIVKSVSLGGICRNSPSDGGRLKRNGSHDSSRVECGSWRQSFTGMAVIFALLFFNSKYFRPQFNNGLSGREYVNEEKIKWETSKISDEYLPRDFPVPQEKNQAAWQKVVVLDGEAEIKKLVAKSDRYNFYAKIEEESEILLNIAYFPGWRVWLNGEEVSFALKGGKILLTPPPGEYEISIRLTNTPVRSVSNLISLFTVVGLMGFVTISGKLNFSRFRSLV